MMEALKKCENYKIQFIKQWGRAVVARQAHIQEKT